VSVERRDVLKFLGAFAASVVGPATKSAQADANITSHVSGRPNVLVFFTDDHGQWLQQAYGNSEVKTPNMERIARHGIRMTNAYTTSPVCSPARASFFTGCMPSQHGIHDWIEESKQASKHMPIPGYKDKRLFQSY